MSLIQRPSWPVPESRSDDERAASRTPVTPALRTDGGAPGIAVVVQSPPAGVRRYELTVRADVPVVDVHPELLTSTFERFDDGEGVVRARAVDVDGRGRTVDDTATLFVVTFESAVDPATVSVDGSLDGHDEEAVPWSHVQLTTTD